MILVDTSVLIDFLKGLNTKAHRSFKTLLSQNIPFGITAITCQEILQGAKSEKEFTLLKSYLTSQRFYHPQSPVDSYVAAAKIYYTCRKKGITIRSTIDCLIAQITIEHDLLLLHNDADYGAIAKVVPLKFF
jgi:hypothetical protein